MAGDSLIFYINGRKIVEKNPDPASTLLDYLRKELQLTATKEGCGRGGCGSCTVMVSRYLQEEKRIRHAAVTACLVPLWAVHACAVTTAEGIGSTREALHPVQERLALSHGTQCGFCSPGMVMSMYALLRNNPHPSKAEITRCLEGNICRCTGYVPILEGFNTFAKDWSCSKGEECCQKQEGATGNNRQEFLRLEFEDYDPSREFIFPSELQLAGEHQKGATFVGSRATCYVPTSREELLRLVLEHPDALLAAGNTALRLRPDQCPGTSIIYGGRVEALQYVRLQQRHLDIGAMTTISRLADALRDSKADNDSMQKTVDAILAVTEKFGSQQIRNMATVGGSIVARPSWSDLLPTLAVLGASVTIANAETKEREEEVLAFWHAERPLGGGDVLVAVGVPAMKENEFAAFAKHGGRRTFDVSAVNVTVKIELARDGLVQDGIVFVHGHALTRTAVLGKRLRNTRLDVESFASAVEPDLPHDLSQELLMVIRGLYRRCISNILSQAPTEGSATKEPECQDLPSGFHGSTRIYEAPDPDQLPEDAVGCPMPHLSAMEHTTGEAVYVDDIPECKGELHMALIRSEHARARITGIDKSEALAIDGVVGVLTHRDVPCNNKHAVLVFPDEEVFASEEVQYRGQTVGAVVATSRHVARMATRKVHVQYEPLQPVVSLQDAIKENQFYVTHKLGEADIERHMTSADHMIEGEVYMGGQEHFYLEPQCALAVPCREKGELTVYTPGQAISLQQSLIALVLGVPTNRIVVKTKRAGGSFGGKEYRNKLVTLPCAVAAHKYQRPVRLVLDRYEDMEMTGGRHPALARYKVGFQNDGAIQALDVNLYLNAGTPSGISPLMAMLAGTHCGGSYRFPHQRVRAYACRTNTSCNTAMRGMGSPHGHFVAEAVMQRVADFLGLPLEALQRRHLIQAGEQTFLGQTLAYSAAQRCWDECYTTSDFRARQAQVQDFNRRHQLRKRGIAMLPTMQGMGYPLKELNQAAALVQVYQADGAVAVSHGGIEMGQGLHTKMVQIASRVLGIPHEMIHIAETSTDKVPNSSSTASSAGTDMNGGAVKDACEQLIERLRPYREASPGDGWVKWVQAAYRDQVCLSVVGYWKNPNHDVNPMTCEGLSRPNYGHGAACAEVEIDCLTGEHQVRRVDIVSDVGKSLNPAIDIGQIEGGFMQGYGLFMLEEIRHDTSGRMVTCGIDKYKLPTVGHVPADMRVRLLKDAPRTTNVYSSKGIGEPPLLCGLAVLLATRQAVAARRADLGHHGHFRFDSPATPARIRHACAAQPTTS